MLDCGRFLLYLNAETWTSAEASDLAQEVTTALHHGMPFLLVHECDPARGGVNFGSFFDTTPQQLVHMKLYASSLATPLHRGVHREIPLALLARQLCSWSPSVRRPMHQPLSHSTHHSTRSDTMASFNTMTYREATERFGELYNAHDNARPSIIMAQELPRPQVRPSARIWEAEDALAAATEAAVAQAEAAASASEAASEAAVAAEARPAAAEARASKAEAALAAATQTSARSHSCSSRPSPGVPSLWRGAPNAGRTSKEEREERQATARCDRERPPTERARSRTHSLSLELGQHTTRAASTFALEPGQLTTRVVSPFAVEQSQLNTRVASSFAAKVILETVMGSQTDVDPPAAADAKADGGWPHRRLDEDVYPHSATPLSYRGRAQGKPAPQADSSHVQLAKLSCDSCHLSLLCAPTMPPQPQQQWARHRCILLHASATHSLVVWACRR